MYSSLQKALWCSLRCFSCLLVCFFPFSFFKPIFDSLKFNVYFEKSFDFSRGNEMWVKFEFIYYLFVLISIRIMYQRRTGFCDVLNFNLKIIEFHTLSK